MTKLGTGLVIFTSLFIGLICLVHLLWKPSSSKRKMIYYALTFFSIWWIVYFIVMRWAIDINLLITSGGISQVQITESQYTYSFMVSKVLLLDLCPFMSFAFPLCIIISGPRLKIARTLAPVAIFCGLITIYFGCSQDDLGQASLAQYLFVGIGQNKLYYLMHFVILVLGVIVLLNGPRFTWQAWLSIQAFLIIYLLYVFTCMKTLYLTNNVTGLAQGDWYPFYSSNGFAQYQAVAELFNNMPYPNIMWLSYFLVWLFLMFLIIAKHFLTYDYVNKVNFINTNVYWYKHVYLKKLVQKD